MNLRYRSILHKSEVNGPGSRTVLFTQGCRLRCPGCQNESLWPTEGGLLESPETVLEKLLVPCDGWTISGGEPLDQLTPITLILERLREEDRGIILFTGYTIDVIGMSLLMSHAACLCDAVVTGPFLKDEVCHRGLRGSSNQIIKCITDRYSARELDEYPHGIEIHADPAVITGFPGGD